MSARKSNRGGARKRPVSLRFALSLSVANARRLAARAEVARLEYVKHSEAAMADAMDAERQAELLLLAIPATCLADIRLRASIVTEMFSDAAERGDPTDGRHLTALSVLLREIQTVTV